MFRKLALSILAFMPLALAAALAAPVGGDSDLLTNGTFKAYSGGGAGTSAPTWTKTTLTLDGTSQTALASNTSRIGFMIINRTGNAQVDVDPAGGAVAANTGIPIVGGQSRWWSGSSTPTSAVTVIGTNTQVINIYQW